MQRGQHKLPGLGGIQRESHDLRRAHLGDDEHVRILAQGVGDRLLKTWRVCRDLALPYIGAAVRKQILKRALDRDDVPGA